MRLYPGRPDGQCAEVVKMVLVEVACDPVPDLAGGLRPHVIHGSQLDRRRAGQPELQGVGRRQTPTAPNNRNTKYSKQLPPHIQHEWLDRRPTDSTASPQQ